jgi:hypothetical protein
MKPRLFASVLVASLPAVAGAHVGSPDIYLDGKAGPYQLFVTVRTPSAIPGVAELEIRAETPGVATLSAVPLPMVGAAAKFAPVPDQLKRSSSDPQFFTGSLWMMQAGSWQIKVTATGNHGRGTISIPIPSAATTTKKMTSGLSLLLIGLLGFLVLGAVAMAGASVREATLAPGVAPDRNRRLKGRRNMAIAFILIAVVLWLGRRWWNSEDASYRQDIYKPTTMTTSIDGSRLELTLNDPGWMDNISDLATRADMRQADDLILDHGHLMHLYMLREPGLDVIYHLHPDAASPGTFQVPLPSVPAGTYRLYADIVHANGFPETVVGSITVPAITGRPLAGDDAAAIATPWQQSAAQSTEFVLPDRYRMRWVNAPTSLHAKQGGSFQFELLDPNEHAPADMALYMGMLGHAAFVKTDGTVFAHIHPNGSISMAAYMKANDTSDTGMSMSGTAMPGMQMQNIPNGVSFPYGLPSPGRYRIFVQMKHGQTVETGVFDTLAN